VYNFTIYTLYKQSIAKCSIVYLLLLTIRLCLLFRQAKKDQLRLWKGFTPATGPELNAKDKKFTGKVVEVGNADNLTIKTGDKAYQKIFFSSFRAPRLANLVT